MPLIKDKYRKSSRDRSRYVVEGQVIKSPSVTTSYETTEQKQSRRATQIREENDNPNLKTNLLSISGKVLVTANTAENITLLNIGDTLKDIIISHYHTGGTASVVSLYWSVSPIADLTLTVSTGAITAVTGGRIFRLFTDTFASQSTLSLASGGLFNTFENINTPIYLHAVCSVLGPEFTIVKK